MKLSLKYDYIEDISGFMGSWMNCAKRNENRYLGHLMLL